jgi:hypothetical protein
VYFSPIFPIYPFFVNLILIGGVPAISGNAFLAFASFPTFAGICPVAGFSFGDGILLLLASKAVSETTNR